MGGPKKIVDLIMSPPEAKPAWIETAILPKGGIFLFGGESKIGKSFLCLEMVRALATGTCLFGCEEFKVPDRARVLFIEQELGEMMMHPRVTEIFGEEAREGRLPDLSEWMYYASKTGLDLSSPEGIKMLDDWIKEVRPNVIFLDPIGKLHSYSENDAGEINKLFHTIQTFVQRYSELGLSFVISHHFGKLNPDPRAARDELDPLNFRGSMRWVGDPDTIITIKRLRTTKQKFPEGKKGRDGKDTYKWWEVKMKFVLRAGAEPDNCFCTINRENDFRVRFKRFEEEEDENKALPKAVRPLPKVGVKS